MTAGKWDRRIRRATELISVYPFAAEGLRFYSGVAALQRDLYADMQRALAKSPLTSSTPSVTDELELFVLLAKFPGFLAGISEIAPEPLARSAAALSRKGSAGWLKAIRDFWQADLDSLVPVGVAEERRAAGSDGAVAAERLLAWIFLQPQAEFLADRRPPLTVDGTPATCPMCGGKPLLGVLRVEGDGAKKSFICMLCSHEWRFRRLFCPGCGEEREPQMAFYSAPELAHIRVDVCDTCHAYLKTVDLTKLGLAIPVVDELAAIPLDLWAREHGYSKLQMNLLGT